MTTGEVGDRTPGTGEVMCCQWNCCRRAAVACLGVTLGLVLSTTIFAAEFDEPIDEDAPQSAPADASPNSAEDSLEKSPGQNAKELAAAADVDPPATPAASAAPKKPAPPAFPGPKTLPATGPWKLLYFENDFSYKKDPDHEWLLGEDLKDLQTEFLGMPVKFSTGGELRFRYMDEDNRLRPGGRIHTDYNLWRWRHYADVQVGDFRVYGEGIEADSFGSTAPDQAIDVNRWDMQNLFADYTFLRGEIGTHTLRYGRQELSFGRQRLVSPLDWANTRRNFEGLRYLLKGDDFKFDAFSTHPVNSATGFNSVVRNDSHFDEPNYNVWFSGTYFTYTGMTDTVIDAYWLWLDTGDMRDPIRPDGDRHLFGTRYGRLFPTDDGSRVWDIDAEGGMQTGRDNGRDVLAGFATYNIGHAWKKAPLTPRLSHVFYYGSGQGGSASVNNTFNTLFPLGHAYWALSDNLSGQNLFDYAVQGDVKPTTKTTLTTAFHWLELASSHDRAYNVAGLPVGTPGHGRDLGTALDVYGSYAFNANFDVQCGYSWFWYGDFIQSQPALARGDATQAYLQASLRY